MLKRAHEERAFEDIEQGLSRESIKMIIELGGRWLDDATF